MPRAFLIKKLSPGKEKDDEDELVIDFGADQVKEDVATADGKGGPFDLSTKPSRPDEPTHQPDGSINQPSKPDEPINQPTKPDEQQPSLPVNTHPGVIEFSPKIVRPDFHSVLQGISRPYKPSVVVVPRPTHPSHLQPPVPSMQPMNFEGKPWMYAPHQLSPIGFNYFPHLGSFHHFLGRPPRMEMPLYPVSGPSWGPREGSLSPDTSDTCMESASDSRQPVVSSTHTTSHPPRYECEECSRSYATYSGLARHKQFHCVTESKKAFTCKYCEKVYISLGALKMHIRTHTLPCKCHICGKCFSRPWLLQGHIRTHTGEKPFACPNCSRAFADRSNLRAHLMTHSDVKKYHCQSCTKTFSRMSLLSKHTESGCSSIRYGPAASQVC